MYLERWKIRALAAAARLGYDPAIVNEAVAVLSYVLGTDWVQRTCSAPHRGSPFRFDRHPLCVALEATGDPQIIELVELSAYLQAAAGLPGYELMSDALKPQYRQTLLPLALVFRLRAVGATALRLEPEAEAGRLADIAFSWRGVKFLMECYRPTISGRPEDYTGRLIFDLMGELSGDEPPISVAMKIRTPLTHPLRKKLVRVVSEAKVVVLSGGGAPVLVDASVYLISVARTVEAAAGEDSRLVLHPEFPNLPNEGAQFFRVGMAPRSVLHGTSPLPAFPTKSCVAIWEDDATIRGRRVDPDAALARVIRKVKRKLVQTRGSRDEARIMVVDSWVADYLDRMNRAPEDYIAQEVSRKHGNSPGIVLTRRTWSPAKNRYTYPSRLFGEGVSQTLQALSAELSSWEFTNSVPALAD